MGCNLRIGEGYDVHRLVLGRPLILGGIAVPYETGLLGHSDADVLTHALMDALLGAAGMGDIGQMFPDSAEEFEGISSLLLLQRVKDRLQDAGYQIVNADMTIVAQRPKLMEYLSVMRGQLAKTLQISEDRLNIKATTEEKLGFTGDGSGVAARAVVLLEKMV